MITKESILACTHYGVQIYAHILRQFYPNETVIKVTERDCGLCRNPFTNGTPTLHIQIHKLNPNLNISPEIAHHTDILGAIPAGDCFTFASDYGNYSDGLRKAFHQEPISYTRRKDREYVELTLPKLSVLLSGTLKQIFTLIPDAENGLFSRFIFYYVNIKLEWMDMFADTGTPTLDAQFITLEEEFFNLYKLLSESATIQFILTKAQQKEFNSYFASVQKEYNSLFGADIIASVRRLGVITYRIAMILSSLRLMETRELPQQIICSDADFNTAIHLSKTLIQHTARVFDFFSDKHTNRETQKTLKEKFLNPSQEVSAEWIICKRQKNWESRREQLISR